MPKNCNLVTGFILKIEYLKQLDLFLFTLTHEEEEKCLNW